MNLYQQSWDLKVVYETYKAPEGAHAPEDAHTPEGAESCYALVLRMPIRI